MLKIVGQNDQILYKPSTPVDFSKDQLDDVVKQMFDTMIANDGMGLAMPQIGINKQLFVMWDSSKNQQYVCINPQVIELDQEHVVISEGCLSFPGLSLPIKRPKSICVEYFDLSARLQTHKLDGIMARCFLHELDHLNGITFDTKVSKLRLNMAEKKLLKRIKHNEQA